MNIKNIYVLVLAGLMSVGCGQSDDATFSLASQEQFSSQTFEVQKVDILWVIDNSGSMKSSQEALAKNFESFANKFIEKDYDFQMAITTTDAYAATATNGGTSAFMGGVMGRSTPNFVDTFVDNVLVGTNGAGDERGMQSIQSALINPRNRALLRDGSQLAVIIVSDEDDTSKDSNSYYLDYLSKRTKSSSEKSNFSVSAITISDAACLREVGSPGSVHKIGQRYIEMAEKSNGTVTSICDDFSDSLKQISDKILNKTEKMVLDKKPIVDSIKVYINDSLVVRADTSLDQENWVGWVYSEETNEITFHGDVVPSANADFKVSFTPRSID